LPSSARETLQQHIAELGACSPSTLVRLGREVASGRHAHCIVSEQPCDACNARDAVCGVLKSIARIGSPA
jgi:hypothetical protein